MSIQILIKSKIKGKRKKYKSLEEMPDDLRQAIERTMTTSDLGTQTNTESTIVVNGKSYNNIEEMPPDIRVLYAKAIKALRKGKMTHDPASLAGEGMSSSNMHTKSLSYAGPGSIEPQSTFSSLPRWLIIGVVLFAAFMGLYVIIYAVG
ncbi:MAG: hypothetical protein JSU83_19630 [Deltaproteobacteria bacterium]|nr:MAG: hypothetical protein JSU83_19630 [Deltaproteobacteria bacterium]